MSRPHHTSVTLLIITSIITIVLSLLLSHTSATVVSPTPTPYNNVIISRVITVHRHGARTPMPKSGQTRHCGKVGCGVLTVTGREMLVQLGRHLAREYFGLFFPLINGSYGNNNNSISKGYSDEYRYNHRIFASRASGIGRAILSAEAVIEGIFSSPLLHNTDAVGKGSGGLAVQPVVYSAPRDQDGLLQPHKTYPSKMMWAKATAAPMRRHMQTVILNIINKSLLKRLGAETLIAGCDYTVVGEYDPYLCATDVQDYMRAVISGFPYDQGKTASAAVSDHNIQTVMPKSRVTNMNNSDKYSSEESYNRIPKNDDDGASPTVCDRFPISCKSMGLLDLCTKASAYEYQYGYDAKYGDSVPLLDDLYQRKQTANEISDSNDVAQFSHASKSPIFRNTSSYNNMTGTLVVELINAILQEALDTELTVPSPGVPSSNVYIKPIKRYQDFSGHIDNLLPLFRALGNHTMLLPPFGSTLIFEVLLPPKEREGDNNNINNNIAHERIIRAKIGQPGQTSLSKYSFDFRATAEQRSKYGIPSEDPSLYNTLDGFVEEYTLYCIDPSDTSSTVYPAPYGCPVSHLQQYLSIKQGPPGSGPSLGPQCYISDSMRTILKCMPWDRIWWSGEPPLGTGGNKQWEMSNSNNSLCLRFRRMCPEVACRTTDEVLLQGIDNGMTRDSNKGMYSMPSHIMGSDWNCRTAVDSEYYDKVATLERYIIAANHHNRDMVIGISVGVFAMFIILVVVIVVSCVVNRRSKLQCSGNRVNVSDDGSMMEEPLQMYK